MMKHHGNDGSTPQAIATAPPAVAAGRERTGGGHSGPEIVALAFSSASAGLRQRVLIQLLASVGTLALAVIGSGAFVGRLLHARSVSAEDTALVTSGQAFELASYVQQSNPAVFEQVLSLLSRDVSTMSALGATLAALAIDFLTNRKERSLPTR